MNGYDRIKPFVTLSNPNDFPEYTIVGLRTIQFNMSSPKPFLLNEGEYYQSFWAVHVTFAAVKKSYLKRKDINKIDWQNDKNVIKSNSTVNPYDFEFTDRIKNVKIDFKVIGFTDSVMIIHRSSETFEFKDKYKPDLIRTYEYKGNVPGISESVK